MIIKLAKIVNEKKLKYWKLIIKFIVEIIVEKKMPRNFAIIIKLKIVGKKKIKIFEEKLIIKFIIQVNNEVKTLDILRCLKKVLRKKNLKFF